MKKYIVFFLMLCLFSSQALSQSSCKINHFYQSGTTTDITEVAYNATFDMELLVVYNPQEQITNKLRVTVQLPVGDNSNVLAGINANPIVISNQNLDYNANTLIIDITGFSTTQQSTFTINVYKARIAAVTSCSPVANVCTSSLKYYNSTNATFVDFPNNVFSGTIYGKHSIGTITTQLVYNHIYYSPTDDAKSPIYVDLQTITSNNTYLNSSVLLHLNSSLPIKKVLVNSSTAAQTVTVGTTQYYSLPAYSSIVRVYFDLPESTNTAVLDLTGEAIFSACTEQSVSFPINAVNYSFAGKPDNDLLTYPSINSGYNYLTPSLGINKCYEDFTVYCYLDNSYNSAMTVQQPIVMTTDIGGQAKPSVISFSGGSIPDKAYIRICGNTNYETSPLTLVGGVFTIPANVLVDKIRLEYLQVAADISTVMITCKNITSGQCNGTLPTAVFKLLKDGTDYLTETLSLYIPTSYNYLYMNYSQNVFAANQEVRPVYLNFPVNNTLQAGDYLSYELSDNMTFAENPDLQFSFFSNTNYQPIADFNAQYFSTNPITYEISADRKKLYIRNITIKGLYTDCNSSNYNFNIRVTTKVSAKPTTITNTNNFYIKNAAGTTLVSSSPFSWSVIVTQSVTNTVFFSCDGGTTKTAGITIKANDPVNVYYTLENTTLYKYNQKSFSFYCTLPTNGIQPALSLVKTTTLGTLPMATIINPGTYTVSYASGNLDNYASLTYSGSVTSTTNILKVEIPSITVDAYEKLHLALVYPGSLGLTSNNDVRFYAKADGLTIPPQSSALIIGPKSDCDVFDCVECVTSFSPIPGQEYIVSAWVKEAMTGPSPTAYTHAGVQISFNDGDIILPVFKANGPIVDGWQRIESSFVVPATAKNIHVTLVNQSATINAFFDDIRVHPFNSNMKSFVYDPSTQKLVAELDENNFATIYEYDDEGILIRVKKETERGVMTIKETRSNQSKVQNGSIGQ